MGPFTRGFTAELEAIAARVADPTLRTIELAMYAEDALGTTLPRAVLVDDGTDPLKRVLAAVVASR